MENIEIDFQNEFIVITSGHNVITLNNKAYTPDAAISYALNELGITKFSEDAIKANLDSVDYYKKQVEELSNLLSESLKLSRDLILKNEKLSNVGLITMLYGRR